MMQAAWHHCICCQPRKVCCILLGLNIRGPVEDVLEHEGLQLNALQQGHCRASFGLAS